MGYVFQKLVAAPGDFSIRGSILDIFPLNNQDPVRIDFFDTEVDSMRTFDVSNQRSIKPIKQIQILPATDLLMNDDQRRQVVKKLQKRLTAEQAKLETKQAKKLADNLEPQIMDLQNGLRDPRLLLFADMIYDGNYSLLDYLDENGIVVFDDYSRITDAVRQLSGDDDEWLADKIKHFEILKKRPVTPMILSKYLRIIRTLHLFYPYFKRDWGGCG